MLDYALPGLTLLFLFLGGIAIFHAAIGGVSRYLWRRSEKYQYANEELYRMVLENAPIVLFALDRNGIFTLSEGRASHTLGGQVGERVGRSIFEVYRDYPEIIADVQHVLAGGAPSRGVYNVGNHTFETLLTPLRDAEGRVSTIIGIGTDISERVQAEKALQHQAYYDALTDLPNRAFLFEQIELAVNSKERSLDKIALIMLDLNRFQEINDTFGHQQGDLLLQQVKQRLCLVVDATATVARVGGDEFVVLLPQADKNSTLETIRKLHFVLESPFSIEGTNVHIEASMGIILSPIHSADALTLLRRADIATHVARREHKAYVFYEPELDQYTPRRLALLGTLRTAVASGDMRLYYQPQVDLRTGATHSVEALVRWHHPEYGLVPPDQFILLAEHTGLIEPLTEWVLENAIKQCGEWQSHGFRLSVSVNLSVWNLREEDLPERIANWLDQYNVPARLLCVEVTESAVMVDVRQAMEILNRLFTMGVRISIDDFGTGYSSLAYLRCLPVDELKIDRSFVQQMMGSHTDMTIVQSTITMAHKLGISVVAEGIENEEIWNMLLKFGCDYAQGYYLSCPVVAPELEMWLQKSRQLIAL